MSEYDVFFPSHEELRRLLQDIVKEDNGGFGFHMWATIVDRDSEVRLVVFSGEERGDQWPGSRVISAQKANTANAFSLPGLSLSTANLYSAVQSNGSLFGLQFSNPVNPIHAYHGDPHNYGTLDDPLVSHKLGGVNVFGGGLPLYNKEGKIVGGIGVSGDSSCADHIICWKLRYMLELDYIPGGISPSNDGNIIFDMREGVSASGWGHPECSPESTAIAKKLPETHPVRRTK